MGWRHEIPLEKVRYITLSFLKENIKQKVFEYWKESWNEEIIWEEEGKKAWGLGRLYKSQARKHTPTFKTKPYNFGEYRRKTQSSYFQARIGIDNIGAFLYKIGKVSINICNFCNKTRQKFEHLFLYCPSFKLQRSESYKNIEPRNLNILFNTPKGKNATLRFLEATECISAYKGYWSDEDTSLSNHMFYNN